LPENIRLYGTAVSNRTKALLQRSGYHARMHPVMAGMIAIAVLGGGWWTYSHATATSTQTRYVVAVAQRGTIVASVTASGQVSASSQLDIKPTVSGEITQISVTPGQTVSAGTLIAVIDPTDALSGVRDAKANVASAQLALAKLREPASALSQTTAENAVSTSYTTAKNDMVSAYLDLQTIMADLRDINGRISSNAYAYWNIGGMQSGEPLRQAAGMSYDRARSAYASAFVQYSSVSMPSADTATIKQLIGETRDTAGLVASAVKDESAFLEWYQNTIKPSGLTPVPTTNADATTLADHAATLNTHIASLTSDLHTIDEKSLSLADVSKGADALDVQSAELSVTKAQNALRDAQEHLADYYIRAPFAGTIASVSAKRYDTAGSGTAIATLVTNQQIADVSLNEVDAAKVAPGDKATLTFDAIDGLTLTGRVAEIDTIGSVSQGVVSYAVHIGFDAQDPRIKPGMTVNAAIQTGIRTDVLMVPDSAVKTQNGSPYVQVFDPPLQNTGGAQGVAASAPQLVPVGVGLSDDTNTEITSGLSEGQQIVVRSVSATQRLASGASAPALLGTGGRAGGAGFGGGTGARIRTP
jgi:RND family efflux transporter MFP subunit